MHSKSFHRNVIGREINNSWQRLAPLVHSLNIYEVELRLLCRFVVCVSKKLASARTHLAFFAKAPIVTLFSSTSSLFCEMLGVPYGYDIWSRFLARQVQNTRTKKKIIVKQNSIFRRALSSLSSSSIRVLYAK